MNTCSDVNFWRRSQRGGDHEGGVGVAGGGVRAGPGLGPHRQLVVGERGQDGHGAQHHQRRPRSSQAAIHWWFQICAKITSILYYRVSLNDCSTGCW